MDILTSDMGREATERNEDDLGAVRLLFWLQVEVMEVEEERHRIPFQDLREAEAHRERDSREVATLQLVEEAILRRRRSRSNPVGGGRNKGEMRKKRKGHSRNFKRAGKTGERLGEQLNNMENGREKSGSVTFSL